MHSADLQLLNFFMVQENRIEPATKLTTHARAEEKVPKIQRNHSPEGKHTSDTSDIPNVDTSWFYPQNTSHSKRKFHKKSSGITWGTTDRQTDRLGSVHRPTFIILIQGVPILLFPKKSKSPNQCTYWWSKEVKKTFLGIFYLSGDLNQYAFSKLTRQTTCSKPDFLFHTTT